VEGHKFTFNYIVVMDPPIIVQYGQGLMNDIYDGGGITTLGAAPALPEPEPEPEPEPVDIPAVAETPAAPPAANPAAPKTGDGFEYIVLAIILAGAAAATAKKAKAK